MQSITALVVDAASMFGDLMERACHKTFDIIPALLWCWTTGELDAGNKNITAADLARLIASAPNLKEIMMYGCPNLSPLPDNLGPMHKLEKLTIYDSNDKLRLTGADLAKIIASAPNLKEICVHNLSRISPLPNNLGPLNSLEKLDVGNSSLTGADLAKLIANAPNLKGLDVSRCHDISQIPDNLGPLNSLEKLDVTGTNLTSADLAKIIATAPNLEIINVYYCCGISPLSYNMGPLNSLEVLNASGTNLTGADLAKIIATAPNLRRIHFDIPRLMDNAPLWAKVIIAARIDEAAAYLKSQYKREYAILELSRDLDTRSITTKLPMDLFLYKLIIQKDDPEEMKTAFYNAWNKLAADVPGRGDVCLAWIGKGLSENNAFKDLVANRKILINMATAKTAFLPIFEQCAKEHYAAIKTPAARQDLYQKARGLNVQNLEELKPKQVLPAVFARILQ